MKTLRIGTIVFALSLLALPAHAAKVGLLGGDFDPTPISDPTVFGFGACNGGDNSIGDAYFDNYRCIFYDFPDLDDNESLDAISSIEFFLKEGLGALLLRVGFRWTRGVSSRISSARERRCPARCSFPVD